MKTVKKDGSFCLNGKFKEIIMKTNFMFLATKINLIILVEDNDTQWMYHQSLHNCLSCPSNYHLILKSNNDSRIQLKFLLSASSVLDYFIDVESIKVNFTGTMLPEIE